MIVSVFTIISPVSGCVTGIEGNLLTILSARLEPILSSSALILIPTAFSSSTVFIIKSCATSANRLVK